MDKSRDARGVASRFSRQIKQSGRKLFTGLDGVGEEFVSLEKPKKERLIKKLNVVNKESSSNEDCVMGCNTNMSDGGNEFPSKSQSSMSDSSTKRFKLATKLFDDCNGVDHSSVPRKLRSAMKNRNRESVSSLLPYSNKLNHTIGGVQSFKKDRLKKSKLNMVKQGSSDWSQKQSVGPITKDEEEAVETLYALAGMFPDNDTASKTKLDSAPSEANPHALDEQRGRPTPAIKDSAVTKDNLTATCPLRNSEAAPSSDVESLQKETAKDNLNEPRVKEEPDSHANKNFHMKTDCCVLPVNVHSISLPLSNRECNDDKPSCNPVNLHVLPRLCLDSGLDHTAHKEISLHRKTELASEAANFGSQLVQQDMVVESRKNGLALWPGLSPLVLQGAGNPGPSSQSAAAKIPAWLDAAMGTSRPCSSENGPSTGKVYNGATARRSLKRCVAHVYISQLIRNLQMPDDKQKLPLQCNQLKPPLEGQGQEILVNDYDRVKRGFNRVMLSNNCGTTTAERNPSEARSSILQLKRLYQDQQQTAAASGLQNLQNQSFNFLSLSAGGEAEATKSFRGTRNALEPLSHFQVSYLQSLPQHQKFVPLAMPQTHYTTSAYPDKPSTAASAPTQQVQLQLPPYLYCPFLGPTHTSSPALTKQQQQQLWMTQLAAHCRPAGNSTAMSQFPNWPNGRQDPTPIPCPLSIISPSPSALEVHGPKYSQISPQQQQQQQQLMAITSSLPSARGKRQDHLLPLVYEEIEGGFRTDGSLPLQLLCNERL